MTAVRQGTDTLDITEIRKEFPILHQEVNGKPLIYFDNAATNQKPSCVIKTLEEYYEGYNANIHRGIHTLAEKATKAFEATRETLKDFINAKEKEEIVFTKGTTESINLVAATYGRKFLHKGDEIIISAMEHHSNIVPWQMLCEETGSLLKIIPIDEAGELRMDAFESLLSDRTKFVSVVYASNSLGTLNPVKDIIEKAHAHGAKVLLDAAQVSAHEKIDVQALDCDFLALSAHKVYGPTGTGALYGKRDLLEAMPPYQGGGEMIKDVSFEKTTYNDIPYKFEAGTPNIADVAAFREALLFVKRLGTENIATHEMNVLAHATERLGAITGVRPIGTARQKVSVFSFIIEGAHHFDIGQMLDAAGIAVRTGHHCTQPLMKELGIEGTIRASFAVYNTVKEVDQMAESLERVVHFLKKS